ncbi:hypothetical protein DFH07DRAFT_569632 [Mycena maculata]|uniref:Uncharacterized protein n=1 Tax=Mycena maculata TaxID=230809 RepID=A0AAD7K5Z6_9AGAR|nr:hypothetical protein DFH07DRAFT_569632 [Mycena maculata]
MFRMRSQLPLGSSESSSRPISVNEYSLYPAESSDHDLIRAARVAAGHNTHWIPGGSITIPATHGIFSVTYEFASAPPEIKTKRSPLNLKEWNATIDSTDDVFSLNKLEDFKSTDLDFLPLGGVKRARTEEPADDLPPKRRKLDLASLGTVIPQPHMLPSIKPTSEKSSSVTAYARSKPIPIPPHTLPLPAPIPYTRRSWVVPVRGSPPWRHATSAVVLLDPTDLPVPPDPKTHDEITWTAPALAAFWSFLLVVRTRNTVGPVGLSFHVSPYSSSNSTQPTYTELSGMGAQPLSPEVGPPPSTASSVRRATVPLSFLDYMKVYHDAADSMQIRNILDAWAYEPEVHKIRLLKGARLVLLDERSKGILVS